MKGDIIMKNEKIIKRDEDLKPVEEESKDE